MQGSITYYQLGILLLFLLVFGIGTMAMLALIRINGLLKRTNAVLKDNTKHLNRAVFNLAEISDNTLVASGEMANRIDAVCGTIEAMGLEGSGTKPAFQETAERIGGYAAMVGEAVSLLQARLNMEK